MYLYMVTNIPDNIFLQITVEMDVVSKPDLTAALKEIRMQYEVLSTRNQQSAEEWYQTKIANVSQEAARNTDNIRQAKEELSEYRRQLQSRTLEVDALRSANESLERQLQEAEDRNNEEMAQMQVRLPLRKSPFMGKDVCSGLAPVDPTLVRNTQLRRHSFSFIKLLGYKI